MVDTELNSVDFSVRNEETMVVLLAGRKFVDCGSVRVDVAVVISERDRLVVVVRDQSPAPTEKPTEVVSFDLTTALVLTQGCHDMVVVPHGQT